MKVICDRGALVESLNLIGGAVVSRSPKPVLACVKLEADADGLRLTATDQEIAVTLSTPKVEAAEPGTSVIPADKLTQIVRESIDPTLTLATEQDVAIITGRDSRYRIYGHSPGDFPATPEFEGDADFQITAGELHRLIAMTIFATARENSRYAINGVLLERDGKKLSVVATDGHRLALAKGSAESAAEGQRSAIIPTKALNLLLRLFDDADQPVRVKLETGRVLFATDAAVLSSALVEGNFPPYRDIIPKDSDKKAVLSTDVIVSAVRRAALLTNEECKGVKMSFTADGLKVTSRAPEMGEAEIDVDLVEYNGEPIEIGFQPPYVLDALKVVEDSQVQFDFKAPNKPGVLRTGPNYLYIVMPVNLS